MIHSTHYNDFKSLRQAYNEVRKFIESETGEEDISLKTKIENDLGCAGDDNYELLEKFIKKYNLDVTGFDYSKHFLSEGELFNSMTSLFQLISIPFMIVFWLIRIVTFGKVNLTNTQFYPEYGRQTLDMTFGDMLVWYLTGKYNLRKNVIVTLNNFV